MAAPSFNFKTEYAKSARSSCNSCARTIEKNELRMAEMVQVRKCVMNWICTQLHFCFAGAKFWWKGVTSIHLRNDCFKYTNTHIYLQIPRWYHVDCFFSCRDFKLSDTSEIGSFDALRWEDQQLIKGKCEAGPTYELRTEYARSGRSTCRGCNQKIKDVRKIASKVTAI